MPADPLPRPPVDIGPSAALHSARAGRTRPTSVSTRPSDPAPPVRTSGADRSRPGRRPGVLFAVAAAGVLLTGCQVDRYDVAYDDLIQARQQDALDRGWVPDWLPESTTDIREVHDPRSGARVLTATLPEAEAFRTHCSIDAPTPPAAPFDLAPPPTRNQAAMRCTGDDYGILSGTDLILWRPAAAPDPDPSSAPATTPHSPRIADPTTSDSPAPPRPADPTTSDSPLPPPERIS